MFKQVCIFIYVYVVGSLANWKTFFNLRTLQNVWCFPPPLLLLFIPLSSLNNLNHLKNSSFSSGAHKFKIHINTLKGFIFVL